MPECDYCGATIEGEEAYGEHLAAEHRDELGPIDRRRVEAATGGGDDDDGLPTGLLVLGAVVLIGVAALAVMFLVGGGGGGDGGPDPVAGTQPTNLWGVHYHGTIEVVIEGQSIDFSRSRYQMQANAFHFENGDGSRWHGHAEDVTLAWAMDSLGFDVNATAVTVGGTTYRDGAPDTTVSVTVNGEPVTPGEYVLTEGDRISIVVERG